jgi:16S rRNA G527 N7-methylase RsmG
MTNRATLNRKRRATSRIQTPTNKTLKFHVNPWRESLEALTGLRPSSETVGKLRRLADWLVSEAIPQGGLGPNEADNVIERHILGSAVFSIGFSQPPQICWDLGSGVGLPGMVLAALWPGTRVRLVDRSQKRCDMARRASRIVGIEVEVEMADITDLGGRVEAIVSRAAAPALRILPILETLLAPGGTAVVSGSEASPVPPFVAITIPQGVLDTPPRLLMMRSP